MNTPQAFVVDTSVAVKWFVDEGGTEQIRAIQLFQAFEGGRCTLKAPHLLMLEMANALMYSHKLPSMRIAEFLARLQDLELEMVVLNLLTLTKAIEIASSCGATIYDCCFLALALESGSVLVTADEIFLRKTRHWPGIVALRLLQLPEPLR